MSEVDTEHAWWSRLRHQGLVLSPVVMLERFADAPEQPPYHVRLKLRDNHTRFVAAVETKGPDAERDRAAVLNWVDAVLTGYVGHAGSRLGKHGSIPEKLTAAVHIGSRSETIRPDRVIFADDAGTVPAVLVMADPSPHVGRGRGRSTYARFLELLRGTGHRLGLLTNGEQFRLIYAGLDFESWCEWESDRWFDDREGSEELAGLRQLLSPASLKPVRDKVPGLLDAIEESRKRQADLSSVLRENVRQAVELLLEEVSSAHRTDSRLFELLFVTSSAQRLTDAEAHEALMQAAVRVVMRMVVCLFAESRGLLPVNDPIYAHSYGLRSLYELLDEAVRNEGGPHGLLTRRTAWPRLMALFRLIHGGSVHGSFPLRAYGGALFRPGKAGDAEHVSRALDLLERHVAVSDATVFALLRKLLRGPLPVVRGRSRTFVEGPVDYTDLRTEFIGLIYEGLLDYRVKRTDEASGPQVFLNLGREPVLPLGRLEEMLRDDPRGLKDLLTTLRKERVTAGASSDDGEEETEEQEDEDGADDEAQDDADADAEPIVEAAGDDAALRTRDAVDAENAALAWAKQAVVVAGLVRRKNRREADTEYNTFVEGEAKNLINRVVSVGEFYLVRAGNTRKGTGTFYTRPQLAVPTVHRTVAPLCYDKQPDNTLLPKKPDELLALRVCDPACGSASFLVAALHYLTDALYRSLCHHCGLDDPARYAKVTLPFGKPPSGKPGEEPVPFPPNDPHRGDQFADRVKALLRRHVVERCIYGVDLNPLAVELARVSLWVETLDRDLPFSFLDHKIKVGNSLVGCWLDRVLDYPLAAWEREGGDGKDGPRTERIETLLKGPKGPNGRRSGDGVIKKEMRQLIETRFQGQAGLYADQTLTVDQVIGQARAIYEVVHEFAVADADARERVYRQEFRENPQLRKLRRALDEWCAVWFWPTDEESFKHAPTPLTFHRPTPERDEIVGRVTAEQRFFHWEVEFPDVFTPQQRGFDATIGNPPWDVLEPRSPEFFSEYDPLYRAYGRQEALRRQRALTDANPDIHERWNDYKAHFKSISTWAARVSAPFDVPLMRGRRQLSLRTLWEQHREQRWNSNQSHPYRLLGSGKANAFKLFMELFWHLLQKDGRLGMIVPSSFYSDVGSRHLRETLLTQGRFELLYAFQNERRVFASVHHSFKQAAIFATKGGSTRSLLTRFRMGTGDSPPAQDLPDDILKGDAAAMALTPEELQGYSPKTLSIVEIRSERDRSVFNTIYANSVRIGDNEPGWELSFSIEFNMSTDSKHFRPVAKWEAEGFCRDRFGNWLNGTGDIALPFYQGGMIHNVDPFFNSWEKTRWVRQQSDTKQPSPKFLMSKADYRKLADTASCWRIAYRRIARTTDTRTFICSYLWPVPSGDSLFLLMSPDRSVGKNLGLAGVLSSLTFDWVVRQRLSGTNLNWFIISECPIPRLKLGDVQFTRITLNTARLTFVHRLFAPDWLRIRHLHGDFAAREWKHQWAVTEADRLRLRVENEAFAAISYGISAEDVDWIVREDPLDSKGFYRVDRHLPFRERLTGLAAAAFRALAAGKWTAESAAEMSNDEFFDAIGIPEMTSERAAAALHLPEPLIRKRQGCHAWEPEKFAKDDPRYGWTWEHCKQDAIALLGSEEAVRQYVEQKPEPAAGGRREKWQLKADEADPQLKIF